MLAAEERIVEQLVKDYPFNDGIDTYQTLLLVRDRLIKQAMQDSRGIITDAAKLLNMQRTTLNQIIVDGRTGDDAKIDRLKQTRYHRSSPLVRRCRGTQQ